VATERCSGQGKVAVEVETGKVVCPDCGRKVNGWGWVDGITTVGRHNKPSLSVKEGTK
jgi:uncharacterized Zn finger protein (UPF0148 family)